MVDFQERDTKRGFPDAGNGDEEDEDDEEETADIDDVREALEERPDERRNGADDDGSDGSRTTPDAGGSDDPTAEDDGEDREASDDVGDDDQGGDAAGRDPEGGRGDASGDGHDHGHGDAHGHGHEDGHDHDDHHHGDVETLGAAVVTISSSRTMDDDPSGDHAVSALVEAGHDVVTRELIADDYDGIQHTVDTLVRRSDVDVVVTTGGTGVTPDDRTIEAVRPLFEKELPGFGELFRRRSEDEIGVRIVATRATAGVADGVPVFCLPGSRDAVALGVEEIVVEVAPHLAGLAARETDEAPARDHRHPVE